MHATGDAAWRAMSDTFSAMAARYGATMIAGTNLPELELSEDPGAIDVLADPDYRRPERVWLSRASDVYNWQWAWGPDGALAGAVKNAYLTPPEEDTLRMTYGDLVQMRPVELPFGRFGIVISKDAWMPDVLGRLDDLGADVLVQSEAFIGGSCRPRASGSPTSSSRRAGTTPSTTVPCGSGRAGV